MNDKDDILKGAVGGFIVGAVCGVPILGTLGGAVVGANYDKIKKKVEESYW